MYPFTFASQVFCVVLFTLAFCPLMAWSDEGVYFHTKGEARWNTATNILTGMVFGFMATIACQVVVLYTNHDIWMALITHK